MLSFVLKPLADAENQCELERYIHVMDSITALYHLLCDIFTLCRETKFVFISVPRHPIKEPCPKKSSG